MFACSPLNLRLAKTSIGRAERQCFHATDFLVVVSKHQRVVSPSRGGLIGSGIRRQLASRSDKMKSSTRSGGARAGPYGLNMVDYTVPSPQWPLPPHPPAQKGATGKIQRFLGPAMASFFLIGAVYVYFNQDEDIYDYWRQVEQGNVPIDEDDDDDCEDEWEDDGNDQVSRVGSVGN